MKLLIITHDDREIEAEVETYDAQAINEKLNSNEVNTVAFGDKILSRISVKIVIPDNS